MPRLARRFEPHVFALLQSAITCAIATTIASPSELAMAARLGQWLQAWLTLALVVLLAAPSLKPGRVPEP